MGLFDSITRFLRKESADIGDAIDDVTESLDRDLTRKERDLSATPEERLERLQGEIDDDPFAAIRDRIEASTAHADAETDVDALDGPVLDGSDDHPEDNDPEDNDPEDNDPEDNDTQDNDTQDDDTDDGHAR